jgi:hypothetical protein
VSPCLHVSVALALAVTLNSKELECDRCSQTYDILPSKLCLYPYIVLPDTSSQDAGMLAEHVS